MTKWRVTASPDGTGELLMAVESTDLGMLSVWTPGMVWVPPDTADRMVSAIQAGARAARGQ